MNNCTHRTTHDQRHTRRDQSKARTCLKGHRPQIMNKCKQRKWPHESVGTHCSHRTCGIQRHPIDRNVPIVNWEQYKDKTYNDSAKQNKLKIMSPPVHVPTWTSVRAHYSHRTPRGKTVETPPKSVMIHKGNARAKMMSVRHLRGPRRTPVTTNETSSKNEQWI